MSNPRKALAEYDPRNSREFSPDCSPPTTGQNAKSWLQKCDTTGRPQSSLAPPPERSKNGASHKIWAIGELVQIWWLAPFFSGQRERAGAVGEPVGLDPGRLQHRHVEVGQRLAVVVNVVAELEPPAGVAGHEVGQVG